MAAQVEATILKIDSNQLLQAAISLSFPTDNISIGSVSSNSQGINSVVQYNGHSYWSSDTQSSLVNAANSGSGGSGGLELESYQNSAMSVPVMAYVYKDADDNIMGVYEPIRNNTVINQRYEVNFPFDNTAHFNNFCIDVDFQNIGDDAQIYANFLQTMVIKCNGFEDFYFWGNNWKGNYGDGTTNGAEINIAGDTTYIQFNSVMPNSYIDGMSAGSYFIGNTLLGSNGIDFNGFNGKANATISHNTFHFSAGISLQEDFDDGSTFGITNNVLMPSAFISIYKLSLPSNLELSSSQVLNQAQVTLRENGISSSTIGCASIVDTTDGRLSNCFIGNNLTYSALSNKTGANIQNIAGVGYELSVTDGGVMATAI